MSKFPLRWVLCLTLLPWTAQGQSAGLSPTRPAPEAYKITGVFVPSLDFKVKSEFSGRVENLAIAKGQAVSKQYLLFRIEDEHLSEDLNVLRAELQAAEEQLQQATTVAEAKETTEEIQVERVREPFFHDTPSYQAPTFYSMSAKVPFTPVDAGGIWPGIDPRIIARSNDSSDAGGIWPSYGAREMVNGEEPLTGWESPFLMPYLPEPIGGTELGLVKNVGFPEVIPPVAITREVETPEIKEPANLDKRLALYQARIERIRAEIAALEHEYASRDIMSPLDGRIHELPVSEGSKVEAGDLLAEIYQMNPMEFKFQVPMEKIESLELGMQVKGRTAESPSATFEGEISFIGAELNADKKTVEVRALVGNADEALKVGGKGDGEILIRRVGN